MNLAPLRDIKSSVWYAEGTINYGRISSEEAGTPSPQKKSSRLTAEVFMGFPRLAVGERSFRLE